MSGLCLACRADAHDLCNGITDFWRALCRGDGHRNCVTIGMSIRKEDTMANFTSEDVELLREEAEQALGRIKRLERKLSAKKAELSDAREAYRGVVTRLREAEGELSFDEPRRDGSVIRFSLRLRQSGGGFSPWTYQYVATRQVGRWYVTGTRFSQGVSWEDLVREIRRHGLVGKIVQLREPGENLESIATQAAMRRINRVAGGLAGSLDDWTRWNALPESVRKARVQGMRELPEGLI